jgi:hypothetical protein
MTLTGKLDPQLEGQLRRQAAATGRTASDIVREALSTYLASAAPAPERSPYQLGMDLFGRHHATPDLASARKTLIADAWGSKRPAA